MQIALKNHNKQAKERLVKKRPMPSALLHTFGQDLELECHSYAKLAFLLSFQSPFLSEKQPHASRFGYSFHFSACNMATAALNLQDV